MRFKRNHVIAMACALVTAPLAAQQRVPFRGDTPIAPQGLPVLPPPAKPVRFATAEGQDIEVVTLVRGLKRPWSLAFVSPDTMLVTERDGQLRVVRGGKLDPQPVAGLPEILAARLTGLMDLALHPDFATNGYVYFSYNKPIGADDSALAIGRGRWDGKALTGTKDVFVAGTDTGGVSRLAFGGDGMLYMSLGGGGQTAAAGPEQSCRQGAAADARGQRAGRQSVRRQGRATSPRSSRSGTATRSAWPRIRRRAASGSSRWARTAATSSTCSSPAATTAGRS